MTPDPDLIRLITAAHHATEDLAHDVQAVELYRAAALAAESQIPGPLGLAVAGVLAIAAEHRRVQRLRGNLGEHRTTLALALAVLAMEKAPP